MVQITGTVSSDDLTGDDLFGEENWNWGCKRDFPKGRIASAAQGAKLFLDWMQEQAHLGVIDRGSIAGKNSNDWFVELSPFAELDFGLTAPLEDVLNETIERVRGCVMSEMKPESGEKRLRVLSAILQQAIDKIAKGPEGGERK